MLLEHSWQSDAGSRCLVPTPSCSSEIPSSCDVTGTQAHCCLVCLVNLWLPMTCKLLVRRYLYLGLSAMELHSLFVGWHASHSGKRLCCIADHGIQGVGLRVYEQFEGMIPILLM